MLAFSVKFLNNDYMREEDKSITIGGRTSTFAQYRKGEGAHDYFVLLNNCVTTTMNAINKGQSSRNEYAKITLERLKLTIYPEWVKNILDEDYRQFGGKGLVVDVKKGNKVKE